MSELLIKNGTVVFENDVYKADLLIKDEKIAGILATGEYSGAEQEIDATGLYIMPGNIDPHMHLGLYKDVAKEFRYDTQRQAIGGLTSLISYHRGKGNYFETLPESINLACENSLVDFAFSLGLCAKEHVDQLEDFVSKLKVTSFKFFFDKQDIAHTFYGIPREEALTLDKADLYFILKRMAEIDPKLLLCVHCEDPELFRAIGASIKEGDMDQYSLGTFGATRPDFAESTCIASSMSINSEVNGNMYVVHTSAKSSVDMYGTLSKLLGGRVTIETCPQYLLLDDKIKCGLDAKVNPPLRSRADIDALWEGIRNGLVHTIGTDNCPVDRAKKYERGNNIWDTFPGFASPGIILPTLISEGFHKRGIPLTTLSQVNSINTARIFNLREKGEIKVGFDADLALVDLNWEREITPELFGYSDFSIYEGIKLKGWPRYTISRGEVIQKDGIITAKAGRGRYIERSI